MIDLKEDLTVFVISAGEDTLDECVDALLQQDCSFHIEHIRDVYPMSAAFQAMPDGCHTPYFIQVDADMILYPHAIRTLYDGIRKSGFFTYLVYGMLLEQGFGVRGSVKAWKRKIFQWFAFRDSRTVDRDLTRRVRRLGFRQRGLGEVLGIHKPYHSPFLEYLKAKSDVEKWRFLKRPVEQYAFNLLSNSLSGFPDTRHPLLGVLLGSLTGWERVACSKDLNLERSRFDRLLGLLAQDEDLSVRNAEKSCTDEKLQHLFASCYSGQSPSARKEMVMCIYNLYSQMEFTTVAAQELLDVVDL